MKRIITCGLAAFCLALLLSTATSAQPDPNEQGKDLVGKPAPDFSLQGTDGKEWKLSDLKGKKVVLLDFGSTCYTCQVIGKELEKIHKDYKGKPVQFLTVCVNGSPAEELKGYAEWLEITYPVLADRQLKAADAYGLWRIPFTVIVDMQGVVRWVHTGHPDDYKQQVREQIDALLPKEPEPADTETKPEETPQP